MYIKVIGNNCRAMKKLAFLIFLCLDFINIYAQTANEIISELQNTIVTYNVWPHPNSLLKVKSALVDYRAPIITLKIIAEKESGGNLDRSIVTIKFDVLKAGYWDTSPYALTTHTFEIYSQSGIEVKSNFISIPRYGNNYETNDTKLQDAFYIPCNSGAICTRLINAFKNLKALAKEDNVRRSAPNILDNAELSVQKISFVAPDESGKLKANQTGCIKVEVKNKDSNNALEISCIVNEKNKSEFFTFEQYTTLDKIGGYETGVINVPIKVSENIDNNTYLFDVKVSYKGRTLKQETISITTSNPRKQQTVSSGTGGANRNKIVRMRKMSGNTYLVSCKVNGLPLDFIFDTGASSVTLSRKQAQFMLRNGYLSRSDIVGSSSYQTASGDIATGMVIKLKRIEISGLVLNNVEATIINSDSAPLLLGQSALSRLGKIQIDYRNSTLTIIR